MEWRCEWCGKPHEENDPPCDNCGHGTFEEAVVRGGPAGDAGPQTTTVWVCPECGRAHPKNSPPCSRCGAGTLEMEERSVDDYGDVTAPTYRDLVTPRYAAGVAVAVGLAALFVLGVTGIVTIPGLTPQGLDIAGVPGNATVAAGIDLGTVEASYLETLNERRRAADVRQLTADQSIEEATAFFNKRAIKEALTDDDLPSTDRAARQLRDACASDPQVWQQRRGDLPAIGTYEDGDALAVALADSSRFGAESIDTGGTPKTGVDVHVGPDGTVYVLQIVC